MHTPTSITIKRHKPKLRDSRGTPLRSPDDWRGYPLRCPRWSKILWWTIGLTIALYALTATRLARGASTNGAICNGNDSRDCVYPIAEGERAPYSGQLITMERAARLVVAAENCGAYTRIELERAKGLCDLRMARCAEEKRAMVAANSAQLDALQGRLSDAGGKLEPWYQRPPFLSAVALMGGSLLALTVILVTQ